MEWVRHSPPPPQAGQSAGKGGDPAVKGSTTKGAAEKAGRPTAACLSVTSSEWLRVRSGHRFSEYTFALTLATCLAHCSGQSLLTDQRWQDTVQPYLPSWHKTTLMLPYL